MNIGGSDLALAKKLQELLELKRDKNGAGLCAAIILGGELIAVCAAGTRGLDNSPADISDLYNIGSVSKVYCAAAIMKLVEMGLVELDAPVFRYLPRFTMRDPRYKDITVRMTLNHSSGLPGTNIRKMFSDRWMGDNFLEEYYKYWRNSKLKAHPGAFSVYCNDGFDLAAAIVEELTGKKYIDFLRDSVTTPAGALTTLMGNTGTYGHVMMSCKGKKPEYVMAIGAGAIRSDISDCARFGWMFIEPNGVLKRRSIHEINRPNGITFLKKDCFTPYYGLGWDSVEFYNKNADLGPGTLAKNGGTLQFRSQLIVSPKYRISAAIASTVDCNTNDVDLLCELIAIALKEHGIDVVPKDKKPTYVAKPVPEDLNKRFGGIYYSGIGVFKVLVENDKLSVLQYDGAGWKPSPLFPSSLEWNGEFFFNLEMTAYFEIYKGCVYLFAFIPHSGYQLPLAQKFNKSFPVSKGWKKRMGKKYIVTNYAAFDQGSFSLYPQTSITIKQIDDTGNLLFANIATGSPLFTTDLCVSCGDNDTNMNLDTPGLGSRDISAFFAFFADGIEHIRNGSFIYIDGNKLPVLRSGRIISPKAEQNAVYKITAGKKLKFDMPEDVNVFMLDNNLVPFYDSFTSVEMPETKDGYIIFSSESPMNFAIEVI